jgi:dihydrofolate synthase / folylpolyglutamate synthase
MTPRERLFALEQFGIKLGLANIATIVNALGNPHRAYPTVHIGGTNGKGSVAAMVERGLRAAGHHTGRYTSPHLFAIEERTALDGAPVDAADFDLAARDVLAVVDGLVRTGELPHVPTFFEATTAIAFEIFKRAGVTAGVIEVGLGGRFDATNVVAPRVTAITSIGFDHEKHLGNSLPEIAFEKAGIIKSHTTVVIGDMPAEARVVIADIARSREAPVVAARPAEHGTPVTLALNGEHQRQNAAVAVEVLKRCDFATPPDGGVRAPGAAAMISALADVEWPARLEWLRVPGHGDLLVDAAHNPAGARALTSYVESVAGRMPLILAVMRDKDVDRIIAELAPAVSRVIATTVDSPRALMARDLAARVVSILPGTPCETQPDWDAAVTAALAQCGRAMAAGSIFLVGPLRAGLIARGAEPVRYPAKASPFFLD